MTSAFAITDLRTREYLATQVLVVGGGAAGVATAITAARQGLQVTLLERYGFCGGGAVAGMSGTICGMYLASNNTESKPTPLVHGFAGEFAQRMTAAGGLTPPVRYGKSFSLVHDPLVWRSVADAMLADAGVRVLLHTLVTDVLLDGGERVAGVQAYTKQGKYRIEADVTVDASGDADLFAMAGFATRMGHEGVVQNPTMIFRIQGVDVPRSLAAYGRDAILPDAVSRAIVDRDAVYPRNTRQWRRRASPRSASPMAMPLDMRRRWPCANARHRGRSMARRCGISSTGMERVWVPLWRINE